MGVTFKYNDQGELETFEDGKSMGNISVMGVEDKGQDVQVINEDKLRKWLKAYGVPENEIEEFIADVKNDVEERVEDKVNDFDSDEDFFKEKEQ